MKHFNAIGASGEVQGDAFLTPEEFEAIRLKDLMGLSQTEAAEVMGISQPTFYRHLASARKKIAEAIVNGRSIRIV